MRERAVYDNWILEAWDHSREPPRAFDQMRARHGHTATLRLRDQCRFVGDAVECCERWNRDRRVLADRVLMGADGMRGDIGNRHNEIDAAARNEVDQKTLEANPITVR